MDIETVRLGLWIYSKLGEAFVKSNAFTMFQNIVLWPTLLTAKKTWMDLKGSNVVVRYFVTEHRAAAMAVYALTGKQNNLTRNAIIVGQVLNWVLSVPLAFVDWSEVLAYVQACA